MTHTHRNPHHFHMWSFRHSGPGGARHHNWGLQTTIGAPNTPRRRQERGHQFRGTLAPWSIWYRASMVSEAAERPEWADRLRRERAVRGWTQADAVAAMRAFSAVPLPEGLIDQWKRWERGRNRPDEFYRSLIAATLGTVVESLFPSSRPVQPVESKEQRLIDRSGMDTGELLQRIHRSSVDSATLGALEFTVEQLCCDYATRNAGELISESREWLSQITRLLGERLTLNQHKQVLDAAGWLALLVGCLEYDTGQARAAEATRIGALELGEEAGNQAITGWAHEMRAWFAITRGRYREVIAAARSGLDAAPGRSVTVQLYAQEAKAWARTGNRRNVVQALEKGRLLLDSLPCPERPNNHFVIDPDKFDFYAMDCYRFIGNDNLAKMHAQEIIRKSAGLDGSDPAPMRRAEAELTLAVVSARNGALDEALTCGQRAVSIDRRSYPSLMMVGSELDRVLQRNFPGNSQVQDFHQTLTGLTTS